MNSSTRYEKLSEAESAQSAKEALEYLNHPKVKLAAELWEKVQEEKRTKEETANEQEDRPTDMI